MKHLTSIYDLTKYDIYNIFDLAKSLKMKQKQGKPHKLLEGKTLAMIFTKSSTRTRVSFEVGMYQLGGCPLFLSANDIQLGRGETIGDTARVLSRYVDGIMIRTFKQQDVLDLAAYGSVPVINGLTDLLHPAQVLADLQTMREHRGSLEGATVAFIGDGNNVVNSWLNAAALFQLNFRLACPQGYEPDAKILARAQSLAPGRIEIVNDPSAAAQGADVLYTDVWTSMGQEAESQARRAAFAGYQINARLVDVASKDVLVMHCLPAHRGEEITADVLDGPRSVVLDQAENRLHAQKAVMVWLSARSQPGA